MSRPLLVIGGSGQLARALKALRPEAVFIGRAEADLTLPHTVTEALERHDPIAVINAAAYTQVDNAEAEEKTAMLVNAQSPTAMAIYCMARNIPFVNFSTDYVFNGSGSKPWKEDDAPGPLNAYGRSKLAGEDGIAHIGGKYLLFRTSWIFDATGKNFLNTILRLIAEREELKIVADQFGAPTYAAHLAQGAIVALNSALQKPIFPSGVYHLCASGETSWYGFANAIAEKAKKSGQSLRVQRILPIPAGDYPLPARRPYNSRLDCTLAQSMFEVTLPDWRQGLAECMELKA